MAGIKISKLNDFPEALFEVTVTAEITTAHKVTLRQDYYKKLTRSINSGQAKENIPPEQLIQKAFEFLLAREPNTAILHEFDISLISHYFPEFEREIGR